MYYALSITVKYAALKSMTLGGRRGSGDYRHPYVSQEKHSIHTPSITRGASFIVAFLLRVLIKCADGSIEDKSFITDVFFPS